MTRKNEKGDGWQNCFSEIGFMNEFLYGRSQVMPSVYPTVCNSQILSSALSGYNLFLLSPQIQRNVEWSLQIIET